jgi:phosphoesterase RecJ-like protein
VHVSFRSKGKVNVNNLAKLFGGGGHHNAAGCMINGTIGQAGKTILRRIKSWMGY